MKTSRLTLSALILALPITGLAMIPMEERGFASEGWRQHDPDRPQPPAVDTSNATGFTGMPADAVALFSPDMSGWKHHNGEDCKWEWHEDGYLICTPRTGDIQAVDFAHGDAQIHLEWRIPADNHGTGQDAGNSGLFMMNEYEAQILGTHPEENTTYPDGMTGAIYGQNPPLVNSIKRKGEWNTYDIIFTRPRFDDDGELISPARMTIFLNGVLVQNDYELLGPTSWMRRAPYSAHADRGPVRLQDHGSPVHYRNLWVRSLEAEAE